MFLTLGFLEHFKKVLKDESPIQALKTETFIDVLLTWFEKVYF